MKELEKQVLQKLRARGNCLLRLYYQVNLQTHQLGDSYLL